MKNERGKEGGNAFKNVFHEAKILDPAIIASRQEAQTCKAIFDRLVLADLLGVNPEVVF